MKIGDSIPDTYPSTQKVAANKVVELIAIPQYGYRFAGWTGDSVAMTEAISVTMTCTKKFTANFTPITHRIQTTLSPSSGGEIIMEPAQPQGGYQLGTTVTIIAKPAHGFAFKEWIGTELSVSGNKATFIVGSDKVITAVFEESHFNIWGWVFGVTGVVVLGALIYIFFLRKRRILKMGGIQS